MLNPMQRMYRWKVEPQASIVLEESSKPASLYFVIERWDDNRHLSRALIPRKIWEEIRRRTILSSYWTWEGTTDFRGGFQFLTESGQSFQVEEGETPATITIRIGDNYATLDKETWNDIHTLTQGYSTDNFTFIEAE